MTSVSARPAPSADVRLMTLDPGHFHAALVQKEMYPGVSPRVFVFAPLGDDLLAHLKRVSGFNTRPDHPTKWELEIYTGADYLERMLRERPGNVVVISGRNRAKIQRVARAVAAGLHVLVDKPWVLEPRDLPALEAVLADADARGTVALDIMTERFEVTSALQRELVADRAVFGQIVPGTEREPGVYMESVHHLMKVVAGAPNLRPWWFFDSGEQGEGLNDVGTHLVDLAQWTLFPNQAIDHRREVAVLGAERWPTMIPEPEFKRVTAMAGFPPELQRSVKDGALEYFCNTRVSYTLRGVHVGLNVLWDWEAPPGGGDTHYAVYRGSRARVEVRQTAADRYRPEVYVVANRAVDVEAVAAAVRSRIAAVQSTYPDVGVEVVGAEARLTIPDRLREGHEAHFAAVTRAFLAYLADRQALPAWERPNMLAKYYVTTTGTAMARQQPPKIAPRLAPR